MDLAAFDVHYLEGGRALAAAVLFSDFGDPEPVKEITEFLPEASGYIPGKFYLRELPAILTLLQKFDRSPEEGLVDAYLTLGDRPGLGYRLSEALGGTTAVIGVAKSKCRGASGIEVFRGRSSRPSHVTAAGLDPAEAAESIRRMQGAQRIPALLKRLDRLARKGALKFK